MRGHARFLLATTVIALAGCAHVGRLKYVGQTISPVELRSTAEAPKNDKNATSRPQDPNFVALAPLFGDTLLGLRPGTGDSTKRYLGRLRDGYTADTLNLMLFGDNRPGFRYTRLANEYQTIRQMASFNPVKIVRGLVTIPWAFVKGMYPDLGLIRDIPGKIKNQPTWGREHQVMSAMLAKIDSLNAHGRSVSAVLNTGDLVEDGQYPAMWERFLRLTRPLSSRVPYFPVAGNHERTDTENGVENWRAATGLPVGGDRLYYCFDTADGWVRVIALDTNPIVDPGAHWTREVQVKYSNEQFTWLVDRVKEHDGPVIVMMHHPPFSVGFHRLEWQRDSVLSERRTRMTRALHESGISIVASGHEHSYQRALLTWPDAVLVSIVTGGAGAPLHNIPIGAQAARIMGEYHVAGSVVKPENVFVARNFHFVHLRLWFGGGELITYAVDKSSEPTEIDRVKIDLARYGVPQIDQHKIPIATAKGPKEEMHGAHNEDKPVAHADSVAASERILSKPAPGKKTPLKKTPMKKPVPRPTTHGQH